MIVNDYPNAKNIAQDQIRWPCVWVSSAQIPSTLGGAPFGVWYETWIFSDCPLIKTDHKTFTYYDDCIRAHRYIVKNLKEFFNGMDKG